MKYTRNRYPDGGIYATITDFSDAMIRERINSYEDLFFIKSLKDVCDQNEVEVDLYIVCMFQQQHDRRFKENESFELKLVCDFINSCNFKRVYIFHPHSDVTASLIERSRVIDNSFFIREVLSRIVGEKEYDFNSEEMESNLILMSSDAGGFKPLIKLADVIEWKGDTESASKSRDPKSHKLTQMVSTMDFKGRNVLIVDDICVRGGTFVGLGKILKERNVGKMWLACSHVTIKAPSHELEQYFERVYTTNSKFDKYDYSLIEVIKTFDL